MAILCLILFLVSAGNNMVSANRNLTESYCPTGFLISPILSKSMFFWTSGFDFVIILFDCSVSLEGTLNCISCTRFRCFSFWLYVNQYMVHCFDFISIAQFPAMICSVFIATIVLLTRFKCSFFWLWANHFLFNLSAFAACLLRSSV